MNATSSRPTKLNLRRAFGAVTAGFVFLALLILGMGVFSLRQSRVGAHRTAELSEQLLPALGELIHLQEATYKYYLANLEFVTGRDEETQARKLAIAAEKHTAIETLSAALREKLTSTEAAARINAFTDAFGACDQTVQNLQDALNAGEFERAMQILDVDLARNNAAMEAALDTLSTHIQTVALDNGLETQGILEGNHRATLRLCLIITGLTLITVIGVQFLSRRIRHPLEHAVERVAAFVDQTTAAASHIADSGQSLAEGASRQAAAVEETSASLEEMSSMTHRNAESSQDAKNRATKACQVVDHGNTCVQQLNTAIEGIKSSSSEIAKIIKTIDEIAFQTNILALNAAVEAARAGEAGAGFAVVADEVRALAHRSAQAARQTSEMVETALGKGDECARSGASVDQVLRDIFEEVRNVDRLVAEITRASQEQSQGIEQINRAMTDVDQVTQTNAAEAEQSASAGQELATRSHELTSLVTSLRELVGATAPSTAAPVVDPHDESVDLTPQPRSSRRNLAFSRV